MTQVASDPTPHDAPTGASLPQFYWCWTNNGLLAASGFGPYAASRALRDEGVRLWREVEPFCFTALTAETGLSEYSFARHRLDDGRWLIVRKVAATTRDGRYFVHGIIDPLGALDARSLLAWRGWEGWVDSETAVEPRADLPTVDTFELTSGVAPPSIDVLVLAGLIAAWADAAQRRRTLWLTCPESQAADLLCALAWMLPSRLTLAQLSFSTQDTDDGPMAAAIAGTGRPNPTAVTFDPEQIPSPPEWADWAATAFDDDPVGWADWIDTTPISVANGFERLVHAAKGDIRAEELRSIAIDDPALLRVAVASKAGAVGLLEEILRQPAWWGGPGADVLRAHSAGVCAPWTQNFVHALLHLSAGLEDGARAAVAACGGEAMLGEIQRQSINLPTDTVFVFLHSCSEFAQDDDWRPHLSLSWSEAGRLVPLVPADLQTEALASTIRFGDSSGAPNLASVPEATIRETVVATSYWQQATDRVRAADFFARVVGADEEWLGQLLAHRPNPTWIRHEFANALARTPDALAAVRANAIELAFAALADTSLHPLLEKVQREEQLSYTTQQPSGGAQLGAPPEGILTATDNREESQKTSRALRTRLTRSTRF